MSTEPVPAPAPAYDPGRVITCARCGLDNRIWGPAAARLCRRCRMLLALSVPHDPNAPTHPAITTLATCGVLILAGIIGMLAYAVILNSRS
ncbi:hypothetical protein ACFXD5_41010 [Streptomyces sp. NPDC059385]|uniref:hypothetical protein n=1 Tax=Streptomyces sp. NPDC059385 TaxID=3346817 RepID=UPI003688C6A7